MVAEDHESRPHPTADGLDPLVEDRVFKAAVGGEGAGRLDVGGGGCHTRKV
jgi:hypothetical protein